jgi:DtxR family Mn-dependent transcriptional regulator
MVSDMKKKKTGDQMKLTSNMEDYLESIYVLGQEEEKVRVKDISAKLGVRKSSVNKALKVLSGKGFIRHEKYGHVLLTSKGKKLSKQIKDRHDLLVRFLSDILGVDRVTAAEDACRIEHVISPVTGDRLSRFIEFVDTCPTGKRPDWLKNLDFYIKEGERPEKCRNKIQKN